MHVKTLLPGALLGLCLTSTALAQPPAPQVSTIRVTGNATLHAKPDRVEIDIGVVTQDPQAGPAAAGNATRLEAVLAALHKELGEKADFKTLSYMLTPDYRYQSGGAQPEIIGYTAANTVRVTLDDLEKVGTVIDIATRSGANRVENIQFTLRDPEEMRTKALRQAATEARDEADTLASALGLKISRVLSVSEGGGYAIPIRPVRLAIARTRAAAEPTPIQAGTLDVNANVILTVEVDNQHHSIG
jgi:uncharacterized protein YggE